MNTIFLKKQLLYKLYMLGFITCISSSVIAMDCQIANELSINIYKRAYDAYTKGDLQVAYAHKDDFWDIFKYGQNCEKVKETAGKLIKANMHKDAKVPINAKGVESDSISKFTANVANPVALKPIQELCSNKQGCTITVKTGGVADVNSHTAPKVFEFTQDKNLTELKEYTLKDHNKNFDQNFRINKSPVPVFQGAPK
ncbi:MULTISPECIES: hypothetical protein [Acinetobacter]|uniref:Uncharacterized protein n=1 Tax=Acinetobacter higginsii TaxID=70347 RepID=N9SF54_9GAMM|nr:MULTISPECIES: hypothetical protein [Acinetobacter]ENX53196.1 hypothetical protein F902_04065 [Acinetobacter higginsii]